MLRAAVFDHLKGATTLLLWGDREGIAALLRGFDALRIGHGDEFAIDGLKGGLTIIEGEGSTLTGNGANLCWRCSREMMELAVDLIEPLLKGGGHQYLDVRGIAKQLIISRDEYPADMR